MKTKMFLLPKSFTMFTNSKAPVTTTTTVTATVDEHVSETTKKPTVVDETSRFVSREERDRIRQKRIAKYSGNKLMNYVQEREQNIKDEEREATPSEVSSIAYYQNAINEHLYKKARADDTMSVASNMTVVDESEDIPDYVGPHVGGNGDPDGGDDGGDDGGYDDSTDDDEEYEPEETASSSNKRHRTRGSVTRSNKKSRQSNHDEDDHDEVEALNSVKDMKSFIDNSTYMIRYWNKSTTMSTIQMADKIIAKLPDDIQKLVKLKKMCEETPGSYDTLESSLKEMKKLYTLLMISLTLVLISMQI